eukprot:9471431-Pyramimonas_sp.AAC.1
MREFCVSLRWPWVPTSRRRVCVSIVLAIVKGALQVRGERNERPSRTIAWGPALTSHLSRKGRVDGADAVADALHQASMQPPCDSLSYGEVSLIRVGDRTPVHSVDEC